ncbi:hypothetical protein NXS19_009809 [Fusarium pseudograminearum]|nr:hypothetical protein NXS19_009809 [Fusarium pseudograminearum]
MIITSSIVSYHLTNMADESTLRQRKPQPKNDSASEVSQPSTPTKKGKKGKKTSSSKADQDDTWDGYSPYVDILRVISFLFVASMGLSYVISGGESYWWGHKNKPEWMTQKFYQELILGPPPPTYMTLDELSLYDGRDPDRPILLAINGTIYDVSPGRRMYGPGGSPTATLLLPMLPAALLQAALPRTRPRIFVVSRRHSCPSTTPRLTRIGPLKSSLSSRLRSWRKPSKRPMLHSSTGLTFSPTTKSTPRWDMCSETLTGWRRRSPRSSVARPRRAGKPERFLRTSSKLWP